jgi:hypothetical protein
LESTVVGGFTTGGRMTAAWLYVITPRRLARDRRPLQIQRTEQITFRIYRDSQWRTQDFFLGGGGSTNSVEDRENGDLGAVAP